MYIFIKHCKQTNIKNIITTCCYSVRNTCYLNVITHCLRNVFKHRDMKHIYWDIEQDKHLALFKIVFIIATLRFSIMFYIDMIQPDKPVMKTPCNIP